MNKKIVIATPFYEVKAYSPYITSLIDSIRALHMAEIAYDYYELSGDSYVDRAKNSLVHQFLESDASHILMIDSDLKWNVGGFLRIVRAGLVHGAEVVGGAYPNKNNWETFGCLPLIQDGFLIGKDFEGTRLIEMFGIPGGFILYSREAFERARPNLNTYTNPEGVTFLECFKCNVEKSGGRVGEDIYFQLRYREMGGKVWCEPDIDFYHFGVKGFEGNYHKHLLKTIEQNHKGA